MDPITWLGIGVITVVGLLFQATDDAVPAIGAGIGNGINSAIGKFADQIPEDIILMSGLAFIGYGVYKVVNL